MTLTIPINTEDARVI